MAVSCRFATHRGCTLCAALAALLVASLLPAVPHASPVDPPSPSPPVRPAPSPSVRAAPPSSSPADRPRTLAPPVIEHGVVFAYGREATPPLALSLEGHALIVTDSRGRRFADTAHADLTAVRLRQIAHLLESGGLLVFGGRYRLIMPPARARELLRHIHWLQDRSFMLRDWSPPEGPEQAPLLCDLLRPPRIDLATGRLAATRRARQRGRRRDLDRDRN